MLERIALVDQGTSQSIAELVREMEDLGKSPKLFQTFVNGRLGEPYTFMTPNAGVHLSLGRLSLEGQATLAQFLADSISAESPKLLKLPFGSEQYLITANKDEHDTTIFTISPVK